MANDGDATAHRDLDGEALRDEPVGEAVPVSRQLVMPRLAPLLATPRWAHPFERDFAALLDQYGIRWSYEPTTFLLARHPDGTPGECFTPDFYLPDLRTYVELTSMRQALVTRKHRKLRRFRGRYPSTRVVMLYRRDYHRILSGWAVGDPATRGQDGTMPPVEALTIPGDGRLLYAAGAVEQRLGQIASQIAERYAALGESPCLIGLGHGGHRVAMDLARRIPAHSPGAPLIDRIAIEAGAGPTRVLRDTGVGLAGRTVTLVPAVISTGLTVDYAAGWLRRRGTAGIDVCALLDRSSARVVSIPLRYDGLPAPAQHLVGYGLELRQQYRDLPGIAVFDAPYDGPQATAGW